MQNVNIIKESKNKTDIVYVFLIDQFLLKQWRIALDSLGKR